MADIENTFTLENVENEIIKRLGESTAQTMIDEDNEDRVIPLFWQSVTDIIISGEYQEEDVAGLIEERKAKINRDGGEDSDIGKIDLSNINIDFEDDDAWDDYDKTMLRYHDIYSVPGASDYLNKIIQEKSLRFIKQILGGDPRQTGEVYVYKVGNELKFFKDNGDVIDKYVNVVYIKSPNPLEQTGGGSLLTIYSLGFIYKAIDLTVNKIKEERQ